MLYLDSLCVPLLRLNLTYIVVASTPTSHWLKNSKALISHSCIYVSFNIFHTSFRSGLGAPLCAVFIPRPRMTGQLPTLPITMAEGKKVLCSEIAHDIFNQNLLVRASLMVSLNYSYWSAILPCAQKAESWKYLVNRTNDYHSHPNNCSIMVSCIFFFYLPEL